MEIRTKDLFFDLQFFELEMQLLISLKNRGGNVNMDILFALLLILDVTACLHVRTLSKTTHIGIYFIFFPTGFEHVVLKQIFRIKYPTELLHEGNLLFPEFQDLLGYVILKCEEPLRLNLKWRRGRYRNLAQQQ
jgi:hypothetical protein